MVKEEIEALLIRRGASVVDGVMTGAGTTIDGYKIPIYLSGSQAGSVRDLLEPMGFNVEVIGDVVGVAAALKMVRGIVIKGLDATCMEARVVAHRYGIHEALLSSLTESLDRVPIRDFVDMLFDTHLKTCGRRAMEAADIEETVRSAGIEPLMASATRRIFERSAGLDLDKLDHESERENRVRIVSDLVKEGK
jgi:3-hydroxyisobutyrate dehydrogenase-like beta-hydroxyacid dehydrogenase